MPAGARRWALAVVVAVAAAAAAGCSPAPTSHLGAAGGARGYWVRSRLLGATPLRAPGFLAPSAPSAPTGSRSAHTAVLALRVGALFVRDASGGHFCTASVVASPGRDLLITAAHCINGGKNGGYRHDIVFIPDYRDGAAPFGVWTPAKLIVAPRWDADSDPAVDVGFVVLKPLDGKNIEDVLGANTLGIDTGYRHLVRVTGYPATTDAPVACIDWTSQQSTDQLRFACGGYPGGTSGSPWVTDFNPRTRTGTIVGVIGGYQQGGDTPAVSYSSYLGPDVERLYRQAVADESG